MEQLPITVSNACRAAGLNRGNVGLWQHRGHLPARDYDLADALSLALAGDIMKMSVRVEAAAAIGWGVHDDWQRVIASSKRMFLLARRADGERWVFAVVTREEIPVPSRDGTLQIDLSAIASRVLGRLRELQGA
jgi:hypothetical protein